MRSPDGGLAIRAIREAARRGEAQAEPWRSALVIAAQSPTDAVASAARLALAPVDGVNADPLAAIRHDLDVEHHVIRRDAVRRLETMESESAIALLVHAAGNADPHIRALAMTALARRDPDRARPLLADGLADAHRRVRLAAAAGLADLATSAELSALRQAAEATEQPDPATRLFIADALARAQGDPLPAAQSAARSIDGPRNLAWACGVGGAGAVPGGIDSPYDAYYMLSVEVSDGWRHVHDNTSKIYYGRAHPIGNPGMILADALQRDQYWLNLHEELGDHNLPWVDGVIYGEESMSMTPDALWGNLWPVFCREAGLDPLAVEGDIDQLTGPQRDAWTAWAMGRLVEGFNELYDFTKLSYGKRRPGIGVGTFLGEQGLWPGPNVADFEWKFDLGAVYHYFGDSRKTAYALVRRYKTIWPDRPVLWLSHGIGVYERTPIMYTHNPPELPIRNRWWRCYIDSATAWIAGADTGWFSIWGFMDKDYRGGGIANFKGPTISPESMRPENLRAVIAHSFKGVEEMLRLGDEVAALDKAPLQLDGDPEGAALEAMVDDLVFGSDSDVRSDEIAARKEQFFSGFYLYRRYLYDLARVFAALPRQHTSPDALVIHPIQNVWYGRLDSPGADLPEQFDFLIDINKVARLDLARYRYITVQAPAKLRDATIDALSAWLEQTPGVLYVHRDLTSDNAAQRGAIGAMDGLLKRDWPWEADVQVVEPASTQPRAGEITLTTPAGPVVFPRDRVVKHFAVSPAPHVTVLARHEDQPVVVLWRHPGGRGAVLFDGVDGRSYEHTTWLRDRLHELEEQGVGRRFNHGVRHLVVDRGDYAGGVANYAQEARSLPGVDALGGDIDPVNGTNSRASIIFRQWRSPRVAADRGVTVVAERTIRRFDVADDGVIVDASGADGGIAAFTATSSLGRLSVTDAAGQPLPTIPDDQLTEWLLFGEQPGAGWLPSVRKQNAGGVTYVRAAGSVKLIPTAPPAPSPSAEAQADRR